MSIVAGYAVSGLLGLELAIPPGYATAIFPPAGLSLAALLLAGRRYTPAVWLGSFLMNLWVGYRSAGALSATAIGVAAMIALGSAMQALFASTLVRRFVGFPATLSSAGPIALFLLHGGIIGCLVGASVGVTTLYSVGFVTGADAPYSWWTWWVGDTIGVMLITPLIFAAWGQPKGLWRSRRLSLFVPTVLGFVLVVALFFKISEVEQRNIAERFNQQARSFNVRFQHELDATVEVLRATGQFFDGSDSVTVDEFSRFVLPSIARHPTIKAVSWLERVTPDSMPGYLPRLQQLAGRPLQVWEKGADGKPAAVAPRAYYTPVTYIEPRQGNAAALGFDVHSEPVRRTAMEAAMRLREPFATGRIQLVQGEQRHTSVLVFLPVGAASQGGANPPAGVLSLVLDIGHIATATQLDEDRRMLYLQLTGNPALPPLYRSETARGVSTLKFASTISFAGRQWQLLIEPTQDFMRESRSWQAWYGLAGGLILVSLLNAFMLLMTGQKARVEADVAERTRELGAMTSNAEHANQLLEAINRAQSAYISRLQPQPLFDGLLRDLLTITGSEFGVILEQEPDQGRPSAVMLRAICHTGWDDGTCADRLRQFSGDAATRELDRLFCGALAGGSVVFACDATGGAAALPTLNHRVGIPLIHAGQIVGVIGLANRPQGYGLELVDWLRPLLATCASLAEGFREAQRRQASEQAREDSELRLRTILDNALDALLTTDEAGRVESANPAAVALFGVPDLTGRALESLLPGFDELVAAATSGERRAHSLTANGGPRGPVPVEALVNPVALPQRMLCVVLLHDLSERLKIEQMKAEFIANMNHELRTPLTAIRGGLSLLRGMFGQQLPDAAKPLLDVADHNSQRLLSLVNDILDIEKIEAGKLPLKLEPTDLAEQVQQAMVLNLHYAEPLQVVLRLGEITAPAQALADTERLQQVLANLISNAVKFSAPEASVELALHAHGGFWRISVVDHGEGIPTEQQDKLFQKFFQVDGSSTRRRGGTGLGLAISRALVEAMGGRIGFHSQSGQGTVFHVDLPAQAGAAT